MLTGSITVPDDLGSFLSENFKEDKLNELPQLVNVLLGDMV